MTHLHTRLKAAREGRMAYCGWRDLLPNTFIPGCAGDGCTHFSTFPVAKKACEAGVACGGITMTGKGNYELRGQGASLQRCSTV